MRHVDRILTILAAAIVAVAAIVGSGRLAGAGAPPLSEAAALAQRIGIATALASPATVAIVTSRSGGRIMTGTVVGPRLLLSDALHGLRATDKITVIDGAGRSRAGALVGRDLRLRLVGIVVRGEAFASPIQKARDPLPGRFAIALGRGESPRGLAAPSFGILSARNRFGQRAVQLSCLLNQTNSGGPVVDLEGRAYGVSILVDRARTADSGIGFLVPWRVLDRAIPIIESGRDVYPAWFGLSVPDRDTPGLIGVPVVEVAEGGPAAKAGIRRGDLILRVGGESTPRLNALSQAMVRFVASDLVPVVIRRGGQKLKLKVKTARPR